MSAASARWRRWAKFIGYLVASLCGLEFAARWAVALGVALAPNALRAPLPSGAIELPEELARRGAVRLETNVGGPPAATLVSWWMEPAARPARGSIVLLHGVRMDRRSLVSAGIAFNDAGYRTLLVDLRGHGESTGHYLTYGAVEAADISELLDALAARGLDLGNVGAYGFSYGASVALDLGARDRRLCAVVAVAPFSSLREVVGDYKRKYLPPPLSLIPDSWFERAVDDASWLASFDPDQSSPLRWLPHSRARQLFIHGTADTQVPLRHSLALWGVAGPLAKLLPIRGASHESLPAPVIEQEALAWFEHWLEPTRCSR